MKVPDRFIGDGRRRVDPLKQDVYPGTYPLSVRRAQARACAQRFIKNKCSNHSGNGSMLWVVLETCRHNAVTPHIKGEPGFGFEVRLKEPPHAVLPSGDPIPQTPI